MDNARPINEATVSPEDVLRRAQLSAPKAVIVAGIDLSGQLSVQFSTMQLEILCFLKDYINLAVQQQLAQRMVRTDIH